MSSIKNSNQISIESKTSRKLTQLYISALTAVALLTITGQLLIQYSISNQLSDSHVVNLAGKQRYMSQQISKVALLIYKDIPHQHYQNKISDLQHLVNDWKKNHLGLQYGDTTLNLSGNNSKEIKEKFKSLDRYFHNILNAVNVIIKEKERTYHQKNGDGNQELISSSVKIILDNEKIFLDSMDDIVHQYDSEAKLKVIFLRKIEMILFFITLFILLIEGLFIFKPAAKTIKSTIRDLIVSEMTTANLARELMNANANLEQSLKDLNDVNFALNNATIVVKTNSNGIITFANDKFCELSGYSQEELINNRFDMINGNYHSPTFFDNLWNTISCGKIWTNEIKNKAKDGTFFWLDATIVPVLNKDGEPSQYIAIYTDITQKFRQSIHEQKIRSASLLEGQEKERRKIARELHDGLGQMLTALKFNIESLKGAPSKKEKQNLEEIRNFMLDTIKEVRRISFNLMPSVLSDFGIIPAFKHLAEQVSKHSGIDIIFENNSAIQRLNKVVEINLYRILQEALNNAVKYAKANNVKLVLESNESSLILKIIDNGIGFNDKNVDKKNLISSGNGITNIQERTSIINGEFKIESTLGEGTSIYIVVPIN